MEKKIFTTGHFELPVGKDTSVGVVLNSSQQVYVVSTKVRNNQQDYTTTNTRLRGNALVGRGTAGTM